ncbi:hypothetical protein AUJ10_00620 [Candidatus Pacearchaeota archaeon CG1_02_31_27]|nr:MAG: hypothetical protein AUJ10_00620 [Candidatus Pacearchaeota archaeon CG1_02_31_27]PIN92320.1 MAG: hypothetical protein COU55_00720 [Candidatus Pacearchaeota archaeon CG10_big_fil_rev_8_21_14_0_10_31_59]PIZ79988.1 MAG: hypothetical protein COX99_03360 [Candidatus Pacearchaeota archaeon CG_4_10_14_0_2_um_filter_31_10]
MTHDIAISEITLRKYEEPYQLNKRELVKKICLSLGLLQPGDSRDIIVDVFLVLIEAKKEKKKLSSEEIQKKVGDLRKKHNLDLKGLADSNIRRQVKRLRDLFFVEKKNNFYNIIEFQSISSLFEEKIEKVYLPSILERIKKYLNELDKIS